MKLLEVTAYNLKSQQILNESWSTLTESQRMYMGRWERELWPLLEQYTKLCEATLTPAQIQQIFQSAEDTAVASGTNTSTLGKVGAGAAAAAKLPVELGKQINAKIDELGRLAQKSGPVKAMDQKFDQLKNTINKKFPDSKILDGVSNIGIWAKDNPGKASLAIGILTTIAALAGGPAGGAAAGLILRSTKGLLTGEKLSTAVGKAGKTAALGAVVGAIGDMVSDNVEITKPASEGGASAVSLEAGTEEIASASDQAPEEVASSLAELTEEQYRLQVAEKIAERYGDMSDEMIQKIADNVTISGNYPENFKANFDGTVVRNSIYLTPEEAQAFEQWKEGKSMSQELGPEGNEWLKQNVEGAEGQISAKEAEIAAKAAAIEKDNILPNDEVKSMPNQQLDTRVKELKASPDLEGNEELQRELRQLEREVADRKFNNFGYDHSGKQPILDDLEESLCNEFELYQQSINEAPLDAIKRGAASVAGAVKTKAAAVGKELGNKVTVSKLAKQWKGMGEPTDTGSIMNILQGAGMSDEQIGQIGQATKVDLKPTAPAGGAAPAAGAVNMQSLADEIKKAGPEVIEAVKAMLSSGDKTQTGGKVKGQVSQTTGAIRKRANRAAKKAAPVAAPVQAKTAAPVDAPAV